MFNWTQPQAKVTAAITKVGFKVKLIKADSSTASAYAVWDSNTKLDLAQGAQKITGNNKQIYIAGNISKAPVPGDYIQQGADQWTIVDVEAYKPVSTVLAYRCVVQ